LYKTEVHAAFCWRGFGVRTARAETGTSGEKVDAVFKHRGKGAWVCKPLYEMGTADALNSLAEVRCVLCRTHVYKKKSPSGMANHATGRYACVDPYKCRISAKRGIMELGWWPLAGLAAR